MKEKQYIPSDERNTSSSQYFCKVKITSKKIRMKEKKIIRNAIISIFEIVHWNRAASACKTICGRKKWTDIKNKHKLYETPTYQPKNYQWNAKWRNFFMRNLYCMWAYSVGIEWLLYWIWWVRSLFNFVRTSFSLSCACACAYAVQNIRTHINMNHLVPLCDRTWASSSRAGCNRSNDE